MYGLKLCTVFTLAGLLLIALPALSESTPLRAGDAFPTLEAQTLARKRVVVPDDLRGKPAFLVMGFNRGAADNVKKWSVALQGSRHAPTVYSIAVLDNVPAFFRGFVLGGIRKSAGKNMLVTFSGTPFEQRFPPGGADDPGVAFIDAKGVVVRTTRTPFSDEAAAEFAKGTALTGLWGTG
ncbi:MAG: hypothetical protein GIX03_07990 [Candidatus Eremiobacteraeota bacterium]|nr:hypothetical protein [Candidatus Eremiobacteraeota bacterium]MBC5805763.1 hypothetical protein [Candidatus Eremiobacteraeota bacterium]MBC5824952.1 hypothetical protein [Candidatus Eremiobacteraeota bacterium]